MDSSQTLTQPPPFSGFGYEQLAAIRDGQPFKVNRLYQGTTTNFLKAYGLIEAGEDGLWHISPAARVYLNRHHDLYGEWWREQAHG